MKFVYIKFLVETREVVSVVGGRASLPCDLTPPFPSDEPHLILFYKDVYGTPIYRSVLKCIIHRDCCKKKWTGQKLG